MNETFERVSSDGQVLTRERALAIIITVLRNYSRVGKEFTPSATVECAVNSGLIEYRLVDSKYVDALITESIDQREGIFYRSLKGKARFGLQEWRPSEVRDAVWLLIQDWGEFSRSQFIEVVIKVAGEGFRSRAYKILKELMEDGRVERIDKGVYSVVQNKIRHSGKSG